MTISEHVTRRGNLHREFARTHPFFWLGMEAVRYAALMALVLAFMDLLPGSLDADAPWARVRFIVGFGVLMAVIQLWRVRHANTAAHPSSSSAI